MYFWMAADSAKFQAWLAAILCSSYSGEISMRVQIRSWCSIFRLVPGLAMLCLICTPNWAAEFGDVQVVSYIGQPLVVEVELTALSNEEASALQVRPSGADVFSGANIQRNPVLASMHWVIRHRDKRQFLRITTDKPVQASFLNMFFELGSKNERSVRALTVWLEPDPGQAQNDGLEPPALATLPQPVASSSVPGEDKPEQTHAQSHAQTHANAHAYAQAQAHAHAMPVISAKVGRECSASQQRCVAVDRENRAIRSQIRSLEKDLIVLNQTILGPAKVALPAKSRDRKSASAPAPADASSSPEAHEDSANASAPADGELFLKKEEETLLPAKKPEPKTLPWKLIAIGAGVGLALLALAAVLYRKRRKKAKKAAKPSEDAEMPAAAASATTTSDDDAAPAPTLKGWKKWRQALTARWQSLKKPKLPDSAAPDPKSGIKAKLSGLWGKLTKKSASAPAPVLEPD